MSSHRCSRRSGFSIIELMVVVGVIAILISLLFPAAARARQASRGVTCVSNLRQIYASASAFKADKKRQNIPALGWMVQLLPYVNKDVQYFKCPESELELSAAALDKAGTWSGSGSSSASSGTSSGTSSSTPNLADTYIHIDAGGGTTWDVPIAESPWMKKTPSGPNSYDFWLEDQGFKGGGDRDFLDVGMRVTDNGNGTVTMQLLPQPADKHSSYNSYVMGKTASGPETIMNNLYKNGGTPAGATTVIPGTLDPNGAGNANGPNGSNLPPDTFNPGSSAAADYGFNTLSDKVYSNPSKVLAMDYTISVVDTSADNWSDSKWQSTVRLNTPIFARHLAQANVLYAAGNVETVPVTTTTLNPAFGNNRASSWDP